MQNAGLYLWCTSLQFDPNLFASEPPMVLFLALLLQLFPFDLSVFQTYFQNSIVVTPAIAHRTRSRMAHTSDHAVTCPTIRQHAWPCSDMSGHAVMSDNVVTWRLALQITSDLTMERHLNYRSPIRSATDTKRHSSMKSTSSVPGISVITTFQYLQHFRYYTEPKISVALVDREAF